MTGRLVEFLLVFALVVVVPLTIRLRGGGNRQVAVAAIAGFSSSLSFLLPQGLWAAVLAAGWIVVPGFLVFGLRDGSELRGVRGWTEAAPIAYLLIGTWWLVLARYGARPMGFGDDIVRLTTVHFHYAGFVAPILTGQLVTWLRARNSGSLRLGSFAHWAVLIATPVIALGITFSDAIGSVGAAGFSAGLISSAVITLREVRTTVRGAPAIALSVSSLSVMATMVLALSYAFGQWLGTPSPSLVMMVWTHGLLNAVGFTFMGVIGWTLIGKQERPPGTPGAFP